MAASNSCCSRVVNLLAAAFIYMVYSNGLNIVQSLIAQGKVGFWPGLVVPHVAAALREGDIALEARVAREPRLLQHNFRRSQVDKFPDKLSVTQRRDADLSADGGIGRAR